MQCRPQLSTCKSCQPPSCLFVHLCVQAAGDRLAPHRSTYGRATGGTDSFSGSQFAAAGGRGPTQEAGSYPAAGAFEEGDSEGPTGATLSSRDAGGGGSSCLSVFVEVQFRGRRQRTSAVDSNAPIWNEQVGRLLLLLAYACMPPGSGEGGECSVHCWHVAKVLKGGRCRAARRAAMVEARACSTCLGGCIRFDMDVKDMRTHTPVGTCAHTVGVTLFSRLPYACMLMQTTCSHTHAVLQVTFPVLGMDQEASPRGLRDSDSMITINVFDEVVTPTAAAKAMRAVARASNTGAYLGWHQACLRRADS